MLLILAASGVSIYPMLQEGYIGGSGHQVPIILPVPEDGGRDGISDDEENLGFVRRARVEIDRRDSLFYSLIEKLKPLADRVDIEEVSVGRFKLLGAISDVESYFQNSDDNPKIKNLGVGGFLPITYYEGAQRDFEDTILRAIEALVLGLMGLKKAVFDVEQLRIANRNLLQNPAVIDAIADPVRTRPSLTPLFANQQELRRAEERLTELKVGLDESLLHFTTGIAILQVNFLRVHRCNLVCKFLEGKDKPEITRMSFVPTFVIDPDVDYATLLDAYLEGIIERASARISEIANLDTRFQEASVEFVRSLLKVPFLDVVDFARVVVFQRVSNQARRFVLAERQRTALPPTGII